MPTMPCTKHKFVGRVETIGAAQGTVATIDLSGWTNCGMVVSAKIVGITAAGAVVGGTLVGVVKRIGTTLTVVGTPQRVPASGAASGDTAVNASVLALVASGNNLIVRATGVSGQTIQWGCEVEIFFNQPV